MNKFINKLFLILGFVLVLTQHRNCYPLQSIEMVADPTPGPLGRQCDAKMAMAADGSDINGIKKCFKYYFSDVDTEDAVLVIDQILAQHSDNDNKCCSIWNFLKCLIEFSSKICTQEENQQWNLFVKQRAAYLEQSVCNQTHFDDPKCNSLEAELS